MTEKEVKEIIDGGDNSLFFKDIPSGESLAETIVALSNGDGGTVLVGVNQDRLITGTSSKVVKESLHKAKLMIIGPLNVLLDSINIKGKKVSVIRIGRALKKLRIANILEDWGNQAVDNQNKDIGNNKNRVFGEGADDGDTQPTFIPSHIDCEYGQHVKTPCFDVDNIANAFFDVVRTSSSDTGNVCFLGVFGRWGRGKTFFFDRLKKQAESSVFERSYDFVTFNSWKYQDIPGIWAHLIHVLLQHKTWRDRMLIFYEQFLKTLVISLSLIAIFGFAFYWTIEDISVQKGNLTIFSVISASAALIGSIIVCFSLFGKISEVKGNKYSPIVKLGIQYESERELEKILSRWNWGHITNLSRLNPCNLGRHVERVPLRKVVLLVEDIDRCRDEKMIETIEALKLILENPIISSRMIVVAALDDNRLIDAYTKHFGYIDDIEKQRLSAIEQMNKIFLMGISLPKISANEMRSYIDALVGFSLSKNNSTSSENVNSSWSPVNPNNPVVNSESINSETDSILHEEGKIDTDNTLLMIGKALERKLSQGYFRKLTPRQVKILFYRLLLASNLVSDLNLTMNQQLFEMVLDISLDNSTSKKELLSYTPLTKVIELCVPYQVYQSIED